MAEYFRIQPAYVSDVRGPEYVSDPPSSPWVLGQLGNYNVVKQPGPSSTPGVLTGREVGYVYVLCDSTMSTSPFPNCVLWWSDRAAKKVTTAATNRGARAGVYPSNGDGSKTAGIFMAVKGPHTVKLVDAPTAGAASYTTNGLYVIPSATAGKADVLAAGTAPTYPPLGTTIGVGNAADATVVCELTIADLP